MSPGPRNSAPGEDWRPTARHEDLRRRADLLARIRAFFVERAVLEVETPLLQAATVTDLHLASFHAVADGSRVGFLQTSPEFAMKRLVAAGSGPIYQICKAFRRDESGRLHNPEFTILEWYRPGWDHHRLLDEMDALLARILDVPTAERRTYAELFAPLGIDPHRDGAEHLARVAREHALEITADDLDRDTWLQLIMSHVLEPALGRGRPSFVLDFPASQAALARLRPAASGEPAVSPRGDPRGEVTVAERFEVYVEGVELANGFHELADAAEQRRRFEDDLTERRRRGLEEVPIDERLLAALAAGFPDCAGVALGVDRLSMLACGADHLDQVVAFPFARA